MLASQLLGLSEGEGETVTAQSMQAQIDALAAQVAALREEIPPAIAEGLRLFADRPPGEKGSPTLQFGVVESVSDTWAMVTLDGQTDPVPINMLGGLVEGERVAVLLVPPSGNLAIGMVQPAVVGSLPPGGTAAQVLTKIDATNGNADWETPSAGGSGFPVGPGDDGTSTASITHTAPVAGTGTISTTLEHDSVPANGVLAITLVSATEADHTIVASTGSDDAGASYEVNASRSSSQLAALFSSNNAVVEAKANGSSSLVTLKADAILFDLVSSAAGFGINVGIALPSSDPGVSGQLYYDPITNAVFRSP